MVSAVSFRHDAQRERRAADTHHRCRCFKTNRIRRELGDAPRDVRHHASNHVEHKRQMALGRRVDKLVHAHLAARTDRHARVVLQGDAEPAVRARSEGVGLEYELSGLRRNYGAFSYDKSRARRDLDAACGSLLRRCRRRSREEDKSTKDSAAYIHVSPYHSTITLLLTRGPAISGYATADLCEPDYDCEMARERKL